MEDVLSDISSTASENSPLSLWKYTKKSTSIEQIIYNTGSQASHIYLY